MDDQSLNPRYYLVDHDTRNYRGGWQTWKAEDDSRSFKIVPAPPRTWLPRILGAMFLAFAIAICILLARAFSFWIYLWAAAWIIPLALQLKSKPKLLPPDHDLLVYDKLHKKLTLPQQQITVDLADFHTLQYVTFWEFEQHERRTDRIMYSELNLVANHNGVERKWSILRSNCAAFDHFLRPLVRDTPIAVMRIKESIIARKFTISPFKA